MRSRIGAARNGATAGWGLIGALCVSACSSTDAGVVAGPSDRPASVEDAGEATLDASVPACVKCGSSCVDLATTRAHCGGCYNACADHYVCEKRRCVLPTDGKVTFSEIYRVGAKGSGRATIVGAVDGIVHFLVSGAVDGRACSGASCKATLATSPAGDGFSFFPLRKTPYGYFATGKYYEDPWLTQPKALALPQNLPSGRPAYTRVSSGVIFWGCKNKTSCLDSNNSTIPVDFEMYRCPAAGCADYATAEPLGIQRSCASAGACISRMHALTIGSTEWLIANVTGSSEFGLCKATDPAACWESSIVETIFGSRFAISGNVILSETTATFLSSSMKSVVLPEGLRGREMVPGSKSGEFIVEGVSSTLAANSSGTLFRLSFDASGAPTAKRLEVEPKFGSPPEDVPAGLASDGTHLYVMRVHSNSVGDRFAVLFRGAL